MKHPIFTNYEATEQGDVISIKRSTVDDNGNPHPTPRRMLSAHVDRDGNLRVTLRHNRTNITMPVAQFVFECFKGTVPPGQKVKCRNGNREDCSLNNLILRPALRPQVSPAPIGGNKISDAQKREIRAKRTAGSHLSDLAAEYGITASYTSKICRGIKLYAKRRKHNESTQEI